MKRLGFFLFFWVLLQFQGLTCPSWADSIKIPLAAPFTGPLASFGEGMKNGALLKAEEINVQGGINGRKVEVILEDELCDPKEAAMVATKLAADLNIFIVVGHLCSSASLAALPFYKEAKLPAISPASTNINLA